MRLHSRRMQAFGQCFSFTHEYNNIVTPDSLRPEQICHAHCLLSEHSVGYTMFLGTPPHLLRLLQRMHPTLDDDDEVEWTIDTHIVLSSADLGRRRGGMPLDTHVVIKPCDDFTGLEQQIQIL
jgi:hypothetical protein